MKKLILILSVIFVFGSLANAQKRNSLLATNDTIAAETTYYNPSDKVILHSGVVGFFISKKDVADSLSVLKMQGSMDNTNFVDLTGNAALAETTTDGITFLYVTAPLYLYYRLKGTAASGDSVDMQTVRYIYKED